VDIYHYVIRKLSQVLGREYSISWLKNGVRVSWGEKFLVVEELGEKHRVRSNDKFLAKCASLLVKRYKLNSWFNLAIVGVLNGSGKVLEPPQARIPKSSLLVLSALSMVLLPLLLPLWISIVVGSSVILTSYLVSLRLAERTRCLPLDGKIVRVVRCLVEDRGRARRVAEEVKGRILADPNTAGVLGASLFEVLDMRLDGVCLVKSSEANAFAVGRKIVVTTGLVGRLEEDEVRAVVEHERAHVRRRDHVRIMAMLLADYVGKVFVIKLAPLHLVPIYALVSTLIVLHALRSMELGADAHAVREVGPIQLERAVLKLEWSKYVEDVLYPLPSKIGELFSSHPRPRARIEKIRNLVKRVERLKREDSRYYKRRD